MPSRLAERLDAALNAHDLEALLALFAEDYASEQPAHPDRAFGGRDQVRENWSSIFAGVPDFRSHLVRAAAEGDTVWSEWRWEGTQTDGDRLEMAGVIVMGERDESATPPRMSASPPIDAAVISSSSSSAP